jgi:general secretion pathway protein K
MFLAYVASAVILLSAIAVSFLTSTAASYRLSRNGLDAAKAEAAVDAGVTRAVLGILETRRERRWRVDGAPQDFMFGDMKIRVSIQDELGRIDLNHADRSLLAGLFRSARLDVEAAAGLADKVLDWRGSSGSGRQPGSTKEPEHRAAGLAYTPRNGPFQSVDELKLVEGMTVELYRRVATAVTVYSGRQFIDPQFAPAEALAALPGQSRDAAAALITSRSSQGARTGTIDPSIPLGGRAFSIRLEIAQVGGALKREVVIRLTDDPFRPYWVLSWRGR